MTLPSRATDGLSLEKVNAAIARHEEVIVRDERYLSAYRARLDRLIAVATELEGRL
jgi:hypothetical protein